MEGRDKSLKSKNKKRRTTLTGSSIKTTPKQDHQATKRQIKKKIRERYIFLYI